MKIIILGAMSADHVAQKTYVYAEMWEVRALGMKRRIDTYELTCDGAHLDIELIRPAVRAALSDAGIEVALEQVLTQAEARA